MENFKFYNSYIKLIEDDYNYRQINHSEIDKKLKHSNFRKFVINKKGMNYDTILFLLNTLRNAMIRPQRLLTDNNNFYIACDMLTNTYYICYKELMMIDIDFYKDGGNIGDVDSNIGDVDSNIESKINKIAEMFVRDVKSNPGNCWMLYRTRGGIHAFLVSKKMKYSDKSSCEYMIKLKCDFNYVIYSYLRGWCVRLNRKQKDVEIITSFITQIGNPAMIDKGLLKLTELHIKMIKVFKDETPSLMYGE